VRRASKDWKPTCARQHETDSRRRQQALEETRRLTGEATRAADQAFHGLVVKALARHGKSEDAEAIADTLIAAAKGLMRSGGDVHVPKARFDERIRRLVAWVID
jgi:hypothetical protein